MGPIKSIVLTAIVTVSSLGAVLYTSCSKDACKSVTCVNKGACVGGTCNCPSGIAGRLCETVVRQQYANTYKGNTPGNVGHGNANNTLTFAEGDTTDYLKMTVTWKDTGTFAVILPIELTLTSTGASFSVTPTSSNYKTYSGGGNVSGTMASMSLTETDTLGHSEYYTFNNFYKQ
jgi:hypothetical protein